MVKFMHKSHFSQSGFVGILAKYIIDPLWYDVAL
jgi:hypothetical protein